MDAAELRPLRIGEILDVAIKIYRSHFATLVKAVAVVVVPVQVLAAIVQTSVPDATGLGAAGLGPNGFANPETVPEIDFADLWAALAGLLVVVVLTALAGQLATATSLKAISSAYVGEEPDWRSSLRFAARWLGPLIWLAFLTVVLLVWAFLACIVPAVYLYVSWSVATPALLVEGTRGRRALQRSRALVRGRWWPTLGAVVLGAILASIVQFAFSALVLSFGASGAADNAVAMIVVLSIAGAAGAVLTTPFVAAVTAVIYFDLRVRKEGFDLELLARRVGVDPPADARPAVLPPAPAHPSSQPPYWPPPPGWEPPSDGHPGG